MLVLPGGVDPHVHLGLRPGIKGSDDYTSGSRAALAGGVTTIANFVNQVPNEALAVTMSKAADEVKAQAIADVLLHATVIDPKAVTPEDLAMLAKSYTLKIFTSRQQFDDELSAFAKLIDDAGEGRRDDDDALRGSDDQRRGRPGGSSPRARRRSSTTRRPSPSCPRRSRRSGAWRSARSPALPSTSSICRRSARSGWWRRPRRAAFRRYVETRILYVHLTEERFERPGRQHLHRHAAAAKEERQGRALGGDGEGLASTCSPPITSGYTRADKMDPAVNIINNRSAGNYLQVNLPMLYSEGVRTKRITLEQMVALTSTNPAKLFGLYPKKGPIAVGSDGDIAIWDPNLTQDGHRRGAAVEREVLDLLAAGRSPAGRS